MLLCVYSTMLFSGCPGVDIDMNNVTLLTANWNQRSALELMLKSYASFHYKNEPLPLIVIDNNSTDDSKEWMASQGINCIALKQNIGHERAINEIWPLIKTQYALLVDTDVEFTASVADYLNFIQGNCVCVSELCANVWGAQLMKDRFGPWFILLDYEKIRNAGVVFFNRDIVENDGAFDVCSYFYMQCTKAGFTGHNLTKKMMGGKIVHYERFIHYGAVSWDNGNAGAHNRLSEIFHKRTVLKDKVTNYAHVNLLNKFNTTFSLDYPTV